VILLDFNLGPYGNFLIDPRRLTLDCSTFTNSYWTDDHKSWHKYFLDTLDKRCPQLSDVDVSTMNNVLRDVNWSYRISAFVPASLWGHSKNIQEELLNIRRRFYGLKWDVKSLSRCMQNILWTAYQTDLPIDMKEPKNDDDVYDNDVDYPTW